MGIAIQGNAAQNSITMGGNMLLFFLILGVMALGNAEA